MNAPNMHSIKQKLKSAVAVAMSSLIVFGTAASPANAVSYWIPDHQGTSDLGSLPTNAGSKLIENCIVYKIMVDSNIVGDIIVRDNHDDTYFLGGLCVIPAYENNGIGQKAMRFLEHQFKGAHHWSLETPANKEQNHYFYKKYGFHITREYNVGAVKIVLFEKSIL